MHESTAKAMAVPRSSLRIAQAKAARTLAASSQMAWVSRCRVAWEHTLLVAAAWRASAASVSPAWASGSSA